MSERGSSLLEVVVAIGLISIAAIGILPAFMVQLGANTRSEQRSGAVRAVEQTMEALRLQDPSTMPESGSSPAQLVTVGDNEYEVVTRFCVKDVFCDINSRHLEIEVSHEGRKIYQVETIYTQLL